MTDVGVVGSGVVLEKIVSPRARDSSTILCGFRTTDEIGISGALQML
jgi:hypothetical protein